MNNTVNQQDDGNPLQELVAFGKKWVRITGDGATDYICHSASIASGYFFNSVAVFFCYESAINKSIIQTSEKMKKICQMFDKL